jgi:hypothetical protein
VKTSLAENYPEFSGLVVGSMRKLSDVTTLSFFFFYNVFQLPKGTPPLPEQASQARRMGVVTTLSKTHPLSSKGLSTDVTNATFYLA